MVHAGTTDASRTLDAHRAEMHSLGCRARCAAPKDAKQSLACAAVTASTPAAAATAAAAAASSAAATRARRRRHGRVHEMLHAARKRDAAQGVPRPQKVPIIRRAAERFEPLVAGVAGVARAARALVSAAPEPSPPPKSPPSPSDPPESASKSPGPNRSGSTFSASSPPPPPPFLRLSFPALVGATRTASVQAARSMVGRVIFGGATEARAWDADANVAPAAARASSRRLRPLDARPRGDDAPASIC